MLTLPASVINQWRVARLSLIAAAFSLVAPVTSLLTGQVDWPFVLPGLVIVLSGVQVQIAARLTKRLAPDDLRSWMTALPILMYVLGGASIATGIWAFAHRAGVI